MPSEVTLSGFAGGEYLPLPASKGLAFPFLLTLEGCPTSSANYAQEQRIPPESQETSGTVSSGNITSKKLNLNSWEQNTAAMSLGTIVNQTGYMFKTNPINYIQPFPT